MATEAVCDLCKLTRNAAADKASFKMMTSVCGHDMYGRGCIYGRLLFFFFLYACVS